MIDRETIINHIMSMKQKDETYARWALAQYVAMLPDMDLNAGIRDAMKAAQ